MAPTPLSKEEQEEQASQLLIGVAALYGLRDAKMSWLSSLHPGWSIGFDVKITPKGSPKVEVPERIYDRAALYERDGVKGSSIYALNNVKAAYTAGVNSKADVALQRYDPEQAAFAIYETLDAKINTITVPANERAEHIRTAWDQYVDAAVEFSPRAAYAAVKNGHVMLRAALTGKDKSTSHGKLEAVCGRLAKTIKDAAGIKDMASYEMRVERIVEGTTKVNLAYNAIRYLWGMKKQAEINKMAGRH